MSILFWSYRLAVAAQESQTSLLSTVMQQEMAQRRQRAGISRQDSRLSVKSLIESIEKSSHVKLHFFTVSFFFLAFFANSWKFCFKLKFQVKSNGQTGDSHSSSSSINSLMSDAPIMQTARNPIGEWNDSTNMMDQSKVFNS